MKIPTYHLYVDDSGSRQPDHVSVPRKDGMDHFAMGGLLIAAEDAAPATAALVKLKEKYNISAPLHSTKMRCCKGEWSWLGTSPEAAKATSFMDELSSLLCALPGNATACVVHRPGYVARYSIYNLQERWRLCKSAYAILVERAVKIAQRDGRKLAVYVEQTGPLEDGQIKEYHRSLQETGMAFNPSTSARYGPLSQHHFSKTLLRNPNFFTKSHHLGQVADLLLYPLVKGKYDSSYRAYQALRQSNKIIDYDMAAGDDALGVKYFCFDS